MRHSNVETRIIPLVLFFILFTQVVKSQSKIDTTLLHDVVIKDANEDINFTGNENPIRLIGGDIFPKASAFDPNRNLIAFVSYSDSWSRTGMVSNRLSGHLTFMYYKLDPINQKCEFLDKIDIQMMNTMEPVFVKFVSIDSIKINQRILCTAGSATSHGTISFDFENRTVQTYLDSLTNINYNSDYNNSEIDSSTLLKSRGIQNCLKKLEPDESNKRYVRFKRGQFDIQVTNASSNRFTTKQR